MDNTQENLEGYHLEATFKVVGAGEIRTRLRPGKHLGMKTKAIHATKAKEFAWQGSFHCHHHQQERYVVVSGALAAVWLDGDEIGGKIYREGESFCFSSGVWHDILTGSGTEFVTIQVALADVDVERDRDVWPNIPVGVVEVMQELYDTMIRF